MAVRTVGGSLVLTEGISLVLLAVELPRGIHAVVAFIVGQATAEAPLQPVAHRPVRLKLGVVVHLVGVGLQVLPAVVELRPDRRVGNQHHESPVEELGPLHEEKVAILRRHVHRELVQVSAHVQRQALQRDSEQELDSDSE